MIMICDIPQTLRAYAKCIQGFVCLQNLLLIELTVRSFLYRHLRADFQKKALLKNKKK